MRLIDADALMDKISSETIFIKDGLLVSKIIADAPTIEPSGDLISRADAINSLEEWQEMQCSACGKWHTTPLMYYFDNFNYCPNCGAKMGDTTNEPIVDESKITCCFYCKRFMPECTTDADTGMCDAHGQIMRESDYCSWAERKNK